MDRTLGNHDSQIAMTGSEAPMKRFIRQGRVKKSDTKTHLITFDDTQSGESDLVGMTVSPLYNVETKEGTIGLPTPGSRIVYYRTGGNIQIILGCLGGPIPIPGRAFTDDQQIHNGYESYINLSEVGLPLSSDIPYLSDFGHDEGDFGFVTNKGKIKIKNSGIIVLRSGDLCFDYMIPESAHRMRHALFDEERLPGLQKLRKAFISGLNKEKFSATYEKEDITDNPISPTFLLREEKGFTDRETSNQSFGWTKPIDLSGPIGMARSIPQTVLKSSAVKRRKVYKTTGQDGQIITKSPVYKKEWRNDGSVLEQVGSQDGGVTYLIKVTKTSTGILQIILGTGSSPSAQIELDQSGKLDILTKGKVSISALEIDLKAPTIRFEGDAITLKGNTSINLAAPTINIDGTSILTLQSEATMNLNAPSIDSLPTTTPVIITPVVGPVITPANLMPGTDNGFEK